MDFSLIVNPELLAARAIANIIDFPNALSVERFAGGLVSLMEFKVRNFSNICQMSIADFRKKFGNVIVCAIERDHKLMILVESMIFRRSRPYLCDRTSCRYDALPQLSQI